MLMIYSLLFAALAGPLAYGMMFFAGTLAKSDAAYDARLNRQYANASCLNWKAAYDAGRAISPGTAEINGYTVTWTEDTCSVTESP